MQSCWARWAATNSIRFRRTSGRKRGCWAIRQALGGFANLRPAFAHPALAINSPLRPEVIAGADILFVRELLGGLYFGQPREWNRTTGEAWNTMRYTRAEVTRSRQDCVRAGFATPEKAYVRR